jgi:hypothetical protein
MAQAPRICFAPRRFGSRSYRTPDVGLSLSCSDEKGLIETGLSVRPPPNTEKSSEQVMRERIASLKRRVRDQQKRFARLDPWQRKRAQSKQLKAR